MAFGTSINNGGVQATDVLGGVVPTGTVDGANTVFTLPDNYQSTSLEIFVDGLKMKATTDYTLSGTGNKTVTMVLAPSQWILATYVKT